MTYTIQRPTRATRQRPIAVVWGNPDRLYFIDSFGNYEEGPPEEIWRTLAFPVPTTRKVTVKGHVYDRKDTTKYIVVTPHKGSIRNLTTTCDARHWSGVSKGSGKYHTIKHDGGPTVYRLFHDEHPEDIAEALFTYVDFLNEHGANYRSTITGGGLALFKTTLDEPVKLWAPADIAEAFWPGRVEYFRDRYETFWNMAYYDLKQAYPTALSQSPMPTRWHLTDPDKWAQHIDGFSYATAYIPPNDPPPHPLQHRLPPKGRKRPLTYGTGAFSGWWTHREMRAADDLGYLVRVEKTWVPDHYTEAFMSERWQELRQGLRSLPGLAGSFGKEADNGLWGLLSFDSTKQNKVRWAEKDGDERSRYTVARIEGVREVHGLGVAVCTAARVREKLWAAMQLVDTVYCATDGIIARAMLESPLSPEWVVKEYLPFVAIKDVGCYAYYSSRSPILQFTGGEAEFNRQDGKKGYLVGDLDSDTLPSLSVKQLYQKGILHNDDQTSPSLLRLMRSDSGSPTLLYSGGR